jgi:CheY-like chemotaxis protein
MRAGGVILYWFGLAHTLCIMGQRLRLLLVDDDVSLVENLSEIIDGLGYESRVAHDVTQALEVFGAARFDGIITDYRLPGADGVELIRAVRQRQAEVPVLMLSALVDHEIRQRAVTAGAAAVIDKPVTASRFVELVQCLIEGQSSGRQPEPT